MTEETNEPLSASIQIRIPFNDLDPAGMVWHGRYFKYFEVARAQLMADIGYGYQDMHASGVIWPVVDANIRYRKPLRLNQVANVTATLQEWELRLKVLHVISNEAGEICCTATTIQVPVESESMELQLGAPREFLDLVQRRLGSAAG